MEYNRSHFHCKHYIQGLGARILGYEFHCPPNYFPVQFLLDTWVLSLTDCTITTWKHHIERTVAMAYRMYVKTYRIFRSEHLNTNIKTKALIRSIMTYACPTWEYAADAHLLKLQRLQNRVLRLLEILTDSYKSANWMWLSKLLTCVTI
jgi:hypothetical protein